MPRVLRRIKVPQLNAHVSSFKSEVRSSHSRYTKLTTMEQMEFAQQLTAFADAPHGDLKEDDRLHMIAACEKLKEKLETPLETTARIMFGGYEGAALRLAIDMKLIDICVSAKTPVSAQMLAEETGADVLLVIRVLRMLAATSLLDEVDVDTFVATLVRLLMCLDRLFAKQSSSKLTTIGSLPDYFASNGYRNPNDANDGPFQYAYRTDQHYFDWLSAKPHLQHAFNVTMAVQRVNRGQQWFEFYPVHQKLRMNDSSRTLLVDIGGGVGHDLINFHTEFPDLPGKLVLEDLKSVVEQANVPDAIQIVGHDFFNPQPQSICNAKAYYLRTVLHDWPDKQASVILQRVRDVMSRDSILLINENALPERNVSLYQCKLDFNMMASYSALDRTEKQFVELLESVGFKLCGTWKPKDFVPGSGTLFEAMLEA